MADLNPSARQVLLDLADRCEREEPSEDFDAAIFHALERRYVYPSSTAPYGSPKPPPYTTSLDAAVTLVPEGWRLYDVTEELDGTFWVTLDCASQRGEGHAKTEAMARVAASLRARAEAL